MGTIRHQDRTQFTVMYHYDVPTLTTIGSDISGLTTSDVFPNGTSLAVGNALYFGTYDAQLTDSKGYVARRLSVRMDITQPTVATALDVVWEYGTHVGGASTITWKPLRITSNTLTGGAVAFNTSGIGEVKFDVPLDWHGSNYTGRPANVTYVYWLRCRVTNVSGLTTQPAWGNQVPDGISNSITLNGYPSSAPAEYADMWDYVLKNNVKNKKDISSTATSGTTTTLTDTTQDWFFDSTNLEYEHRGKTVYFYGGTNAGEHAVIVSNTADTLTLNKTLPSAIDNTTQYTIVEPLVMSVFDKFRGGTSAGGMKPYFYFMDTSILMENTYIKEPEQGFLGFYNSTPVFTSTGSATGNGFFSGVDLGGGKAHKGCTVCMLRRAHYSTASYKDGSISEFYNRTIREIYEGTGYYINNTGFSEWGSIHNIQQDVHNEFSRSSPLKSGAKLNKMTTSSGTSSNIEPPVGLMFDVTSQNATYGIQTNVASTDVIVYADLRQNTASINNGVIRCYNYNASNNVPTKNFGYYIDCEWGTSFPLTGDIWVGTQLENTNGFWVGYTRSWKVIDEKNNPLNATFQIIDEQGTKVLDKQVNEDGYINEEYGTASGTFATDKLTKSGATWTTDQWKYRKVLITNDDDAKNQDFITAVLSNTSNTLTLFPTLPVTPTANTRFVILPQFIEGHYTTPDNTTTERTAHAKHTVIVKKSGYETLRFIENMDKKLLGGDIVMKRSKLDLTR